ncbi:MAG: VCBS repeat-containing protein [Phycisphaerales bacterium]|nr:VCBS repeat-containing protein [Phycisphaerales bacterium]
MQFGFFLVSRRRLSAVLGAVVAAGFCSALVHAADTVDLTDEQKLELAQHFGFGPMQIYKIKHGMSQLRIADLNNDGRKDILVWNSHQNRIEVLYQPSPDGSPATGRSVAQAELKKNELPNRGDMRVESIPVSYRVSSMEVAELTGDNRLDIVFFGEPKELVILPGNADGSFGPADGVRAPDGDARGGAIAIGDFNGDKRSDVALIGAEVLQIFHQKPEGGLAKPLRIVHNIKQPYLLLSGDFNKDGRTDLLVGVDDDEYGANMWLQEANGTLGPLRRVKMPKARSLTVARGADGDELLAIETTTGRLKHYNWGDRKETASLADWPQVWHTYPTRSQSKRRPIAVADVNHDGKPDVIAADPDSAQFFLFEQGETGLHPGVAYPGLAKALDICVADIDGDGRNEILSASAEEKMIGVSKFEGDRVTFPRPFESRGEPLAVTVGSLRVGQKADVLAYATRIEKKLHLVLANPADGKETATWPLEGLDDDPAGIRLADANQDGLNDVLIFVPFGALQTYLQKSDGTFEKISGAGAREGLVKEVALAGFEVIDVTGDDKPELLFATKTFARALIVKDGQWTVVDQYNPETSDAQITGLAVLPGEKGSPTVALYDKRARDLLIMKRREDRTYAVSQTMPIGSLDVTYMGGAALAGDRAALLIADARTLMLAQPGEDARTLVERRAHETIIKDAYLLDSVVGDLNHDGIRDVALFDGRKANVEILTDAPNGEFVKALSFQVFQGKRFRDDPNARGEPREGAIGDVTGDGRDDLVLLIHDRVIVYPGE